MSIIFPGNYVAHLNAYREQGVEALPGVEFYKGVGALVLNPDNYGNLDADGQLPAGTYDLLILSPDMRQDDKPRLDKPLVVPTNAVVYRTAISAPGVKANAAADTIAVKTLGANAPASGSSRHGRWGWPVNPSSVPPSPVWPPESVTDSGCTACGAPRPGPPASAAG